MSNQKSVLHGLVIAVAIPAGMWACYQTVMVVSNVTGRIAHSAESTYRNYRRSLTQKLVALELEDQLEKAGKKSDLVPINEMGEEELRFALGSNVGKLDQCRETLEEIKNWASY